MKQSFLGDIVNYIAPGDPAQTPLAAIVLAVHFDGSVDLRVDGGYCQGTSDIAAVVQTDVPTPGHFVYAAGTAPLVGDIVNYRTPANIEHPATYAASIVAVHADAGAVDLLVFNGYCQGNVYIKHVKESATGDPATYFYPDPALLHLGTIVNYRQPAAFGAAIAPGIVIAVYPDESVDLRVSNGYTLGSGDVPHVKLTGDGEPGTFFYPKGAKGAGRLAQPLDEFDNDIVALEDGSDIADIDDLLQIDVEYMTVIEVINDNNYKVLRAQDGSPIAAHEVGAIVKLAVPPPASQAVAA